MPRFEAIRRLHHHGLTLKEIADQNGLHWSTVRRMFLEHRLPWVSRRDFERKARESLAADVRRPRVHGHTATCIAATLAASRKRVRRILEESADFHDQRELTS
ncbi:MAG: hypothetical protein IRZ18_09670 [Clostridia bacterium]|nr:hypothetical protein [Clostridia bacterium]